MFHIAVGDKVVAVTHIEVFEFPHTYRFEGGVTIDDVLVVLSVIVGDSHYLVSYKFFEGVQTVGMVQACIQNLSTSDLYLRV